MIRKTSIRMRKSGGRTDLGAIIEARRRRIRIQVKRVSFIDKIFFLEVMCSNVFNEQ